MTIEQKIEESIREDRVLFLPINKQWFDMILSGEKKEEYRDITQYYLSRLTHYDKKTHDSKKKVEYKKFDYVCLTNGYNPKSRRFFIEYISTHAGIGKEKWGAKKNQQYYVITVGEVVMKINF